MAIRVFEPGAHRQALCHIGRWRSWLVRSRERLDINGVGRASCPGESCKGGGRHRLASDGQVALAERGRHLQIWGASLQVRGRGGGGGTTKNGGLLKLAVGTGGEIDPGRRGIGLAQALTPWQMIAFSCMFFAYLRRGPASWECNGSGDARGWMGKGGSEIIEA